MVNLFSKVKAYTLKFSYRTPFACLSLITFGLLILVSISGSVIAHFDVAPCSGWPFCSGNLISFTSGSWLSMLHRLIVAISGIALFSLLWKAWLTQRSQTVILVSTTAAFTLFFAQALLGARLVQGLPLYLDLLHKATALAVWAGLVVQVVAVGLVANSKEEEQNEEAEFALRRNMLRDFLMLTKPVVVALLLVTTFAGMVIGARAWPEFRVIFWTLFGGFLAAGGSGAINQYIDRFDDLKMQRTQKRPIPSGRLTAGEGLAVGVAMTLTSFYVMIAFVNVTAALLTLAGIVYYVLLYSLLLKKTTVQNIVIGGGAGAIPPLVGWAAATGSLNIPSLFLFAVVFMWTPPHFWALALVRRADYARAGVPMLPVVRGEKETRKQVLLYTVELVVLTLSLPLFGLGGSIYLVGAVILGAWLLSTALKVWRKGGNKLAWKMYRYSSMYLAFLFLILMIDRLL
jgi:heme o synthase